MLRAITFDFWGTLVDAGHSLRAERVEFLWQSLWQRIPIEQVDAAYEQSWEDFVRGLDQGFGLTTAYLLSRTLDILHASLSPSGFAATLRYWQEVALDDPPSLLEGVPGVLKAVREKGLFVGLISDTGATPGRIVRQILARKGILSLFDWLTFSDELGVTKRSPVAFTLTLRAFGVRAEEALHVGDLPTTDIYGAQLAGMHTALLVENTGYKEGPQAEVVLERLRDLPAVLTHWD